jgi:hypothetical protein
LFIDPQSKRQNLAGDEGEMRVLDIAEQKLRAGVNENDLHFARGKLARIKENVQRSTLNAQRSTFNAQKHPKSSLLALSNRASGRAGRYRNSRSGFQPLYL